MPGRRSRAPPDTDQAGQRWTMSACPDGTGDVMPTAESAAEMLGSTNQRTDHSTVPAVGRGERSDGRVARSQRTRVVIVDAMRALHAEGDLRPTAPRIADRAGVSLRTVWQQFGDMQTLLVEAIRRDNQILRSLKAPIDADQPLAARVESFVGQRARILEQMSPTWRAARLHYSLSEPLRQNKALTLAQAKVELERIFALELSQLPSAKRRQLADALHAISIWSFWESLRADLGLGVVAARQLVSETFGALLAEAGFR
jgi:TetR/AcrR family transcriptional regulator, regulator of autoinduction and epiphytic fitness